MTRQGAQAGGSVLDRGRRVRVANGKESPSRSLRMTLRAPRPIHATLASLALVALVVGGLLFVIWYVAATVPTPVHTRSAAERMEYHNGALSAANVVARFGFSLVALSIVLGVAALIAWRVGKREPGRAPGGF